MDLDLVGSARKFIGSALGYKPSAPQVNAVDNDPKASIEDPLTLLKDNNVFSSNSLNMLENFVGELIPLEIRMRISFLALREFDKQNVFQRKNTCISQNDDIFDKTCENMYILSIKKSKDEKLGCQLQMSTKTNPTKVIIKNKIKSMFRQDDRTELKKAANDDITRLNAQYNRYKTKIYDQTSSLGFLNRWNQFRSLTKENYMEQIRIFKESGNALNENVFHVLAQIRRYYEVQGIQKQGGDSLDYNLIDLLSNTENEDELYLHDQSIFQSFYKKIADIMHRFTNKEIIEKLNKRKEIKQDKFRNIYTNFIEKHIKKIYTPDGKQ